MTGVRSRKGTDDILIHTVICEDENGGFEYLFKAAVEL